MFSLLIVKKDNERKINAWARINNVAPRVLLGILVYIATAYLSETEEHSSWLRALSVKFLEFEVSRSS